MKITPEQINAFILISTIIFTMFGLIWKTSSPLNFCIKFGLIIMAVFGFLIIFKA